MTTRADLELEQQRPFFKNASWEDLKPELVEAMTNLQSAAEKCVELGVPAWKVQAIIWDVIRGK